MLGGMRLLGLNLVGLFGRSRPLVSSLFGGDYLYRVGYVLCCIFSRGGK